jgi:hypothetical protein
MAEQPVDYIKLTMAISLWDKLTNDEKLDRLTNVLTRAGSDVDFRNRCLASAESAKQAVKEEAGVEFSDDFRVQFLTPEERLKSLVLAVPDYIATENGVPEARNAEDFQVCTYHLWRA